MRGMHSSKFELCVAILKFLALNDSKTPIVIQIATGTTAQSLKDCLIFLEEQKLIGKISTKNNQTYTITQRGVKVSQFFQTKKQTLQKTTKTTNQSSNFT
jgi:predicted transcriptional regulator